jgi:hypothetical protein
MLNQIKYVVGSFIEKKSFSNELSNPFSIVEVPLSFDMGDQDMIERF